MRLARALTVPLLGSLAIAALVLAGCGSSSSTPSDPGTPPGPAKDHSNIVLLDRLGNPLKADSTEPYSPRQTCGACHNVDNIANGYHFQQGRTDKDGNLQLKTDFFGDNRDWLLSDGMYGKW